MRGFASLRYILLASLLAPLLVAPRGAEADVFKLFAEAHGGAMLGTGTGGDVVASSIDAAFFERAPVGTYGARIGAQFLVFEGEIEHHQFTDGDRVATWTQFGAGLRFEVGLGAQTAAQKSAGTGGYAAIGATLAFGIGTGQQVTPPLSNDEVTDKGFLLQGKLELGKHLNKVLDIGIAVPVSYGYFFKNGLGAVANDVSTHYQSAQVAALLVVRGNIRLF